MIFFLSLDKSINWKELNSDKSYWNWDSYHTELSFEIVLCVRQDVDIILKAVKNLETF